jgi:chemotaxis family two-component system sensor kinase Cph1
MPITHPNVYEECEKEPLANSGLIQPNGVLLYIEKSTGQFCYVTENAADLLGEGPEELLGQDGKDWLEQNLPDLASWPTSAGKRILFASAVDMGFGELDVLISGTSNGWMVELEASQSTTVNLEAIRIGRPQGQMDNAGLQQLQQSLVDSVAKATGYDRVMLYRFQTDWSGEVLAEAVDPGQGAYLALRFPATDIPAIARSLYAQTPYRHIPDSLAQPIAIKGRSSEGTTLDLTWSDLRSVSPAHMQYLANMNVMSSFSTSIMMDGKLWGLVACHNNISKAIPLAAREHCKTLAAEFVGALSDYRNLVQRDLYAKAVKAVEPISARLTDGADLTSAIAPQLETMTVLAAATSAALIVGDSVQTWGPVPDGDSLMGIHDWCLKHQSDPVFCLDDLPAKMEQTEGMARSCGVLGIGLRAKHLNNALVNLYLFRPEEAGEVAWAGNPNKPVELVAQGHKLSPRTSFEKWVEVRDGHSRTWDEDARFVGQQLRDLMATAL